MSRVPDGWTSSPIGDVTSKVAKTDPVSTGRRSVHYVDIGLLDGPVGNLTSAPEVASDTAPSRCRQLIVAGDTLYSTVRPYLRKIAYIGETLDHEFASTGFSVLRPSTELEPKFLYYFALSQQFEDQILPFQKGVSYPAVLDKEVRAQKIWFPARSEQRRIVQILEDHLSRLDAAESYASAAIGRGLENLRASTWKQTFVDSKYSPAPLASVVTIANGQTPKGLADRLVAEESANTVPFYKVGDMNAGDGRYMSTTRTHIEKETAAALGLHIRDSGTVLIPKRGGAIATNKKRVLPGPAAYDLNTMGLVPSAGLDPLYLWHWLQGIDLGKLADGSQVPQINGPQIRGLAIPLPARGVQTEIVAGLEHELEARTRLAAVTAAGLKRNDSLRRAVLAAAFTGKLTGHHTDDERIEELAEAGA